MKHIMQCPICSYPCIQHDDAINANSNAKGVVSFWAGLLKPLYEPENDNLLVTIYLTLNYFHLFIYFIYWFVYFIFIFVVFVYMYTLSVILYTFYV